MVIIASYYDRSAFFKNGMGSIRFATVKRDEITLLRGDLENRLLRRDTTSHFADSTASARFEGLFFDLARTDIE